MILFRVLCIITFCEETQATHATWYSRHGGWIRGARQLLAAPREQQERAEAGTEFGVLISSKLEALKLIADKKKQATQKLLQRDNWNLIRRPGVRDLN